MTHTLLIVPGLGDSSPGHWQNHWLEQLPNTQKVNQKNWYLPDLQDWLNSLDSAIAQVEGPIVLIAHSLAVVLITHWSKHRYDPKVKGALLVAPADVDSCDHTPPETWNFAPIPLEPLPFPSILITSTNDPYITLDKARFLAEKWQSTFINIGDKGHINAASNLGLWDEGQQIMQDLVHLMQQKQQTT
ncbi:alpha/beta hydrolase [Flavobacterium sp.]|uniref:RBBP9/YdeN family alpha/beta hydrolase n=1 Tax=Flavobacterium sp. TaxID=239 RepID=UPI00261374C2|nr:alpha/beta hydrolase [Flavobacterium sp.]MDG2431559.1 alpha/beta hydrolase [Flavobacterium sp.]